MVDQIVALAGCTHGHRGERPGIAVSTLMHAAAQDQASPDERTDVDRQEILKIDARPAQQLGQRRGVAVILEEDRPCQSRLKPVRHIGTPPLVRLVDRESQFVTPFAEEPRQCDADAHEGVGAEQVRGCEMLVDERVDVPEYGIDGGEAASMATYRFALPIEVEEHDRGIAAPDFHPNGISSLAVYPVNRRGLPHPPGSLTRLEKQAHGIKLVDDADDRLRGQSRDAGQFSF